MDDANNTLNGIFLAYATERQSQIRSGNTRFVHYTSAEVAADIIRSREIWMRRATMMNDFMEVQYGIDCLVRAYKGASGEVFRSELDRLFPGFRPRLEKWFDGWMIGFRHDTFLMSLSEHRNEEDLLGRLSMWRAYGGSTGVALVLKNAAFLGTSDALRVYSSPVAYMRPDTFAQEFEAMGQRVRSHADFLKAQGETVVDAKICSMFRFAVLATKHPGFHEELEWRIIHSPSYEPSERVSKTVETIQGVPQHVIKVPLKDYPDHGFVGAELNDLLDRIIIGPTRYPYVIADAFSDLLRQAQVTDPAKRICISDIPLR
jgi:hypothetical protein